MLLKWHTKSTFFGLYYQRHKENVGFYSLSIFHPSIVKSFFLCCALGAHFTWESTVSHKKVDRYGVKCKEHKQNPHPPQQDQAQRESLRLTSAPRPDDRQTQHDTEEQDRCAVIGGACLPAWLCSVTAGDQGCAAPPRLEEWRDRRLLAAARAPQILWVTTTQISYTFTDCFCWNIGLSFSTKIKLSNSLTCIAMPEFGRKCMK